MKGIIFNLLEDVVTEQLGDATWDRLLDAAELDGAYTSLGSYPDADLLALVAAASAALDKPADDVVRWFGIHAIPLLANKYPQLFERHRSTRPFLLTLNGIIHPEVRKLYPGADTPDFDVDETSADELVLGYQSKRRLCALAEGLIEGAARHYGETVRIRHSVCMKRGDRHCRLALSFVPRDVHAEPHA
ncbi:MAG TPA: heme NO-binding domain-containing protein [Candidatus Binatia bacterium]|jgi:hypothetical protein|nr:heme NO-binding domain-containing protein [Candidatus Binatia bacterium]